MELRRCCAAQRRLPCSGLGSACQRRVALAPGACGPLRRSIFPPLRHVTAALPDGASQGTSAALDAQIIGEALDFGDGQHDARAAPAAKNERERVASAGELPQPSTQSSWEEWLRHFDAMDELADDAAHYQVELNAAVRQERYGDAARHKRRLAEIQAADTVATVQRELQAALASEQYATAAELRDGGLVGLAGWWAGKDGPEDFNGHLLHVKPEFGRWTGRIYTAKDIAAMNGWRENKLAQLMDRAASDRASAAGPGRLGGGGGDSAALGGGTVGTPLMEVFVRQQPPAGASSSSSSSGSAGAGAASTSSSLPPPPAPPLVPGRLVHQAVALRPPPPKSQRARGRAATSTGSISGAASTSGRPYSFAASSAPPSSSTASPASPALGAGLNPASVVRLSIAVARDGSARITVLPPRPVRSQFSGWEEEEMRATLAALAGDDLQPPPAPRAPTPPPRSPVASRFRRFDADPASSSPTSSSSSSSAAGARSDADRFPSAPAPASAAASAAATVDDADDDLLTELTRIPARVVLQGRDRFTFSVVDEAADAADAAADAAAAAAALEGGSGVELPRWAMPIDDDDDEEDEEAAVVAEVSRGRRGEGSGLGGRLARGGAGASAEEEVDVELLAAELLPPEATAPGRRSMLDAADAAAASREEEEEEGGEDARDADMRVLYETLSTGYGKLDAVATSVSSSEQEQRIVIEIPVGRLVRQQQRSAEEEERRASGPAAGSSSSSSSSGGAAGGVGGSSGARRGSKDTFDRLAERVVALQASRSGRAVPAAALASALRSLAQRLLAGELLPDGSSAASATVPSPAAAGAAASSRLAASASTRAGGRPPAAPPAAASTATATGRAAASRITYSRLPADLPRSDPFCGLYLGAFGPHGPELIQLNRAVQDGEEVVLASKVTGDVNVPAGEVSFRARVGRRHRLDSRGVYPDDLGIVARYKGEGRVAMAGYRNARWVDGELLVFAVGASAVTGGAELGFVWSVPGEKRFLILLNKLDLKECEK